MHLVAQSERNSRTTGRLQDNTKIALKRAFLQIHATDSLKMARSSSVYVMMLNIIKIAPVLLDDKQSRNMECYLSYIQILRASSFCGSKVADNLVMKSIEQLLSYSCGLAKLLKRLVYPVPLVKTFDALEGTEAAL